MMVRAALTAMMLAMGNVVSVTPSATNPRLHASPFTPTAWAPGPLVSPSVPIVGRAVRGETTYLLTARRELIAIDFGARRVTTRALGGVSAELWGLASEAATGMLWTLAGRSELVGLTAAGKIETRLALRQPHLGVFSGPTFLVYQPVPPDGPAPALWSGPPGESQRQSFGRLVTRTYPGFVRPEQWALNLAFCGLPSGFRAMTPCWIGTRAVIDLVSQDGRGNLVELRDIAPDDSGFADVEAAPRPLRDVLVTPTGDLLVLSTSGIARGSAHTLRRYHRNGAIRWTREIERGARLFLLLQDHSLWFLSHDGVVLFWRIDP